MPHTRPAERLRERAVRYKELSAAARDPREARDLLYLAGVFAARAAEAERLCGDDPAATDIPVAGRDPH
jgi:hypothetical protein